MDLLKQNDNILHKINITKPTSFIIIILSLILLLKVKPQKNEGKRRYRVCMWVTFLCLAFFTIGVFKILIPNMEGVSSKMYIAWIILCIVFYIWVIIRKNNVYRQFYLDDLKFKRLLPFCVKQ